MTVREVPRLNLKRYMSEVTLSKRPDGVWRRPHKGGFIEIWQSEARGALVIENRFWKVAPAFLKNLLKLEKRTLQALDTNGVLTFKIDRKPKTEREFIMTLSVDIERVREILGRGYFLDAVKRVLSMFEGIDKRQVTLLPIARIFEGTTETFIVVEIVEALIGTEFSETSLADQEKFFEPRNKHKFKIVQENLEHVILKAKAEIRDELRTLLIELLDKKFPRPQYTIETK